MAVTYSRTFCGGRGQGLSERDLRVLAVPQLAVHRLLRDYCDTHVSCFGARDANIPRGTYCVERVKTEGITGIGYQHTRRHALGAADAQTVIEIVSALAAEVRRRLGEEEARLLHIAVPDR
jgi:hypothetical protein